MKTVKPTPAMMENRNLHYKFKGSKMLLVSLALLNSFVIYKVYQQSVSVSIRF